MQRKKKILTVFHNICNTHNYYYKTPIKNITKRKTNKINIFLKCAVDKR